jgi:hypothetical protein
MRDRQFDVSRACPSWPLSLAVVSTAWSDYPDIIMRRTASLATAMLWGWYVTARYDLKHVISIFRHAIAVMALASFVITAATPGRRRRPYRPARLAWHLRHDK